MSARIVFDLDGTLIDSAPDIHGIANALLEGEGLPPITLGEARNFIGNGASAFVARVRAARSIPESEHARLLKDFVGRYDYAVDLTVCYPGVIEALDALLERGHRLGVCTNKPVSPCRSVLSHLGLDIRFNTVWGGDSLPAHKPDPTPLIAAFEALGTGAQLFVGDSDVDAEAAERAEVPFLLFTEGYRRKPVDEMPHDVAFSAFSELPEIVDRILSHAE